MWPPKRWEIESGHIRISSWVQGERRRRRRRISVGWVWFCFLLTLKKKKNMNTCLSASNFYLHSVGIFFSAGLKKKWGKGSAFFEEKMGQRICFFVSKYDSILGNVRLYKYFALLMNMTHAVGRNVQRKIILGLEEKDDGTTVCCVYLLGPE
jgi:hypothetical protein